MTWSSHSQLRVVAAALLSLRRRPAPVSTVGHASAAAAAWVVLRPVSPAEDPPTLRRVLTAPLARGSRSISRRRRGAAQIRRWMRKLERRMRAADNIISPAYARGRQALGQRAGRREGGGGRRRKTASGGGGHSVAAATRTTTIFVSPR